MNLVPFEFVCVWKNRIVFTAGIKLVMWQVFDHNVNKEKTNKLSANPAIWYMYVHESSTIQCLKQSCFIKSFLNWYFLYYRVLHVHVSVVLSSAELRALLNNQRIKNSLQLSLYFLRWRYGTRANSLCNVYLWCMQHDQKTTRVWEATWWT